MGLDPLRGASVLLPVPPYPGSPGYLTNGSTRILPHRYFESDGAAKTRRLLSLLSRSLWSRSSSSLLVFMGSFPFFNLFYCFKYFFIVFFLSLACTGVSFQANPWPLSPASLTELDSWMMVPTINRSLFFFFYLYCFLLLFPLIQLSLLSP